MKGILLAGGAGTRLYPLTLAVSKQLLPVHDKPLVYYPLCTLMLAGIRDILIISTPDALPGYQRLLGDGGQWGISFTFASQPRPEGIAQALIIGRDFIGHDRVALILGDNVFLGDTLATLLRDAGQMGVGALTFAFPVTDPQRFAVAELNDIGDVIGVVEKPSRPLSNLAVTGLYFYDSQAIAIAADLGRSGRGELEITDVNREYLRRGQLRIERLGPGTTWLDTGTHAALREASELVRIQEIRSGQCVGSPEVTAYQMGFIGAVQLQRLARPLLPSGYGERVLRALSPGLPTFERPA